MRRAGALQAGLTESMVEKVVNPQPGDFEPDQYAAVQLVGKLLANPRGVDDELRAEVERHFTREEVAEMVLVTMMNRENAAVKVVAGLEIDMPVTVFTAHGF